MMTAALQNVINAGRLQGRDLSFAIDLVTAERRYGSLTPKQAPWVARLLDRANGAEAPRPTRNLGDVAALVDLFNRPRLKFPKVCLQTTTGQPVVFHRAGAKSAHPGSIS